MKANIWRQNTPANRIFAGLLAFWMSGAVFLLCCSAVKVQAVEIEICPLSRKGHCSKKSDTENASRFNTVQGDNVSVDCCGFFSKFFDKIRKLEESAQLAAPAPKPELKSPSFAFVNLRKNVFTKYRPPVLNRGGTYLRNCVFRI